MLVAYFRLSGLISYLSKKKFPGKFYSALAGFVEPGESFEDAVLREMWEEAGVKVWDVRYHSGQPWVNLSYDSCGVLLMTLLL